MNYMKRVLLLTFLSLFSFNYLSAQQSDQDVFIPIGKYIQSGDYEKLSAWFADNLELDILGFTNYTPKSFSIIHKSGQAPMKYAVSNLNAGGEKFRVILFVKTTDDINSIQQLRIERE
jgi:hypothetical protein